jgi:Domain of unknown function (DUF4349)
MMRIIPFPGRGDPVPSESWHVELEAALNGERDGPLAGGWRELRQDVRATAPSMAPEFEQRLGELISGWTVDERRWEEARAQAAGSSSAGPSAAEELPSGTTRSRQPSRRSGLRWLPRGSFGATAGMATAVAVVAIVAAVVIGGPRRAGQPVPVKSLPPRAVETLPARQEPAIPTFNGAKAAGSSSSSGAANAGRASSAPVGNEAAAVPSAAATGATRVQQLAASITLASTPTGVQSVADAVARLTVSDGGFVQSSQVQVQREGASEATLDLSLPSAKLPAALASLGRLAPMRAESQSLNDITGAYDAAQRELADATAQRGALLRALSRATTQGQIDSLRAQLSLAGRAIAQARSSLRGVSRKASAANVEVTVVGDAQAGSEGLTLHRGLHDVGRLLTITLVVLIIGLAALVPLALLLSGVLLARRAWRRYQRERALSQS